MDDASPATFGDRLRSCREAAGLSQEALAERSGVSSRGISDLERGVRSAPRLETVRLLADALQLAPDDRAALLTAARASFDGAATGARAASPASLPVPPTPLIGRQSEIAHIRALLTEPDVRLVTITGPGGVGKTRLALAVAATLRDVFLDGVWFVDLAPVRDPALVLATIAATLDVTQQRGRSVLATLQRALADRRLLLVVDNCEHVLAAVLDLARLLAAAPNLALLATSRARLALRAEHELPLTPLPVADAVHLPPLAELVAVDSIALFVARARSLQPDFALTDANAAVVAGICARLDGLPLAIELAAAQVKLLSPQALLARLERRLPVLTTGARDAPDRQRTLRDAIAWSVDLLAPTEQTLFRRLGVFAGGWTLEAAESVANLDDGLDVFGGLATLVDTSLVRRLELPDGTVRFGMLETIREFAVEHLAASDEAGGIRAAHARYILTAVERLQLLELGAEHAGELNWLETEHANVRAALAWFADAGESSALLQLAGALWPFWYFHTHLAEGRHWLTRALAADADAPLAVRARALHGAGQMAHWQGDDAQAIPLFEAALALWRDVGERRGAALALMLLGIVNEDQGKYAAARPFLEEAAALYRAEGATAWAALAGAYHLGMVEFGEGNYPQAQALLEEALRRFQETSNQWGVGNSLYSLGLLAHQRGDPQGAARRYGECLAILPESRSTETAIVCLAGVAALATEAHPEWAARLFGVAAALAGPLGVTFTLAERPVFEQAEQTARSTLGDARFAAAYEAMRNLTLEQASAEGDAVLTLLRANLQAAAQGSVDPAAGPALTARELDVLRLIVAGRRDQEIAAALFLSRRTVQTHVTHLFAKLRVNTRAEAAAFAVRRGLL